MRSPILLTFASISVLAMPACSRSREAASAPAPAPRRTPTAAPARTTAPSTSTKATAEAWAEEVLTRTNAARRAASLAPLSRSVNLVRAASIQAEQMAKGNVLEHDIPGAQYPTLGTRLTAVQYPMKAAGENIGEGWRSPAAAVAGWMSSSGHRTNILSTNYTEIGTAVAMGPNNTVFWVQVFGRR